MNIVIVESPAKAKTVNKYLGSGYRVLASYGHVRDLPSKNGSVLPDKDFEMHWDVEPKAAKRLEEIAKAVKGANKLILATDPDREGEAISWHVYQILNRKKALDKVAVERVVFNAVTKEAVLDAMRHPREIDGPLVNAYLARRALDYLVGFTLSPVLWRKLPGARSAGRVQSVALRLVCDREAEIEAFKTQEYWSLAAELATLKNETFLARLTAIDGKKLEKFDIADEATAMRLKAALQGGRYVVQSVESKSQRRHPAAPFTTSTLQQEASRKLGFSPRHTMQLAQRLYEGVDMGGESEGLITYMRTDGVQIAPEAISAARRTVEQLYGRNYVPPSPRQYETKAKNAQEAHEAIRPTDFSKPPEKVARYLDSDSLKLYKLVWQRTLASQASSAEIERTTAEIGVTGNDGVPYGLRATGSVIRFDGFLKLYEEGTDDVIGEDGALPILAQGDALKDRKIEAKQHFTEPPPRYTEASLIKKMEELGIGRPSTYASTLNILRDREYVRLDKKRLHPEDKGRLVTAFLENFFARYVEYDFTADLEEKLDLISAGQLAWKDVLRDFWRDFIAAVQDIGELRITEVLDALNDMLGPHIFPGTEAGGDPRACPSCETGRLSLKIGKFGAFIGCSNYPDCRFTRQLADGGDKTGALGSEGKLLGTDPDTELDVTLRTGRFGPYVQLGENGEEKPKRASIPKGFDPEGIDLTRALSLLSLPREIGAHPETGKPITAGFGRFGPYVQNDGKYASLSGADEVFTVGINRAVSLLAEKAANRIRRGATVIKDLGEHPELKGAVQVLSGRYGPYVKHGKVNATLPKDRNPEEVTMADAVELIAARAAKGPAKKPARKAKKTKKEKEVVEETAHCFDPRVLKRVVAKTKNAPKSQKVGKLPSKQEILDFLQGASVQAGKREIARAFGVKGGDRVALKELLRDMAEDGLIAGSRRKLQRPGVLPSVTVLEIVERDSYGEFIARPANWPEERGPPPRILIVESKQDKGPAAGIGDRVLARITPLGDDADTPYQARPIKRLPRATRSQLGIFRALPGGSGVIDPVDRKQLKEWRVARGATNDAENGELVRFELGGPARFGGANARVTARLGNPQDQRATSLIAIHAHGIPDTFPEAVLSEADAAKEPDLKRREDLRHLPFVTIDPVDARDRDDAVWAEADPDPRNKGGWVAMVAIADVASYVKPGSALDKEARARGNSVYFPDRVVPMLPERISNHLCSLQAKEARPCLAVRMVFDKDGRKRGHRFLRGLMRSAAALAYEQAQGAIDGKPDDISGPLLEPVLLPLWGAYGSLTRARTERAPLDLDLPERKIQLDEQGRVRGVITPARLDSHRLIEEFMIAANVAAAEELEAKHTPLIYRVHDQPSKEKLAALSEFLSTLGVKLPKTGQLKPAHFNRILAETRSSPAAELVGEMVLRSQAQAEYSAGNFGHFGLNLRRYAHFTSPIRRYADLMVHRALIRALKLGNDGLTDAEIPLLEKIAEAISGTERRAMAAERETADRLIAAYLADRIGARFAARVSGLTRTGLFVRLNETGADGFVPASSIGHEYFYHDEKRQALIGEETGAAFQLGDPVEVRLVEAIPSAGALRFELLSEGRMIGVKPARGRIQGQWRKPQTPRKGRGRGRR